MKNSAESSKVTLCVLKPDALKRGIVDNIIDDIRKNGYEISNFMQKRLTIDEACTLYYESKDQPYFLELLKYMMSSDIISFLVRGKKNIIRTFNNFVGSTDPKMSQPGTLRKKIWNEYLRKYSTFIK